MHHRATEHKLILNIHSTCRCRSCQHRLLMIAKDPHRQRVECDGSSTGLGFGLAEVDVPTNRDHCLVDLRPSCFQVDIGPPQTEGLTPAEPGRRDQHPQRRQLVATRRLQKRAQRLNGPCFDRSMCRRPLRGIRKPTNNRQATQGDLNQVPFFFSGLP